MTRRLRKVRTARVHHAKKASAHVKKPTSGSKKTKKPRYTSTSAKSRVDLG